MYQVPILVNDNKVVGAISLNNEMEKLLSEGVTFVLCAEIIVESNRCQRVVGVTLSIIPSVEVGQ